MLQMENELKLLFPTVMRYRANETRFVGIFKTQENENVYASFNVPNYPEALGITFETGIDINESTYQSLITKSDTINFLDFLKFFSKVVLNAAKQRFFNRRFYSKFCNEFRELKNEYRNVKFVFDDKNECLVITHIGEFSEKNEIEIKLDFHSDSNMYEVSRHTFPVVAEKSLFHPQLSLALLVKTFLNFVETFKSYYEALHKIDSVCWVSAPTKPTYLDNYRTIVIGENNICVRVTLNPWAMSSIPELRFFGPTEVVDNFKQTLSENLVNWESEADITQNILKVLDLAMFPMREEESEAAVSADDVECLLCCADMLNGQLPDLHCDNATCRKPMHQVCLYEWLSRLPHTVYYYGSITGPCPNCEKSISCKAETSNLT